MWRRISLRSSEMPLPVTAEVRTRGMLGTEICGLRTDQIALVLDRNRRAFVHLFSNSDLPRKRLTAIQHDQHHVGIG